MEETNMENNEARKILVAVAFDADKNTYFVDLAKGSNIAETAFAFTVVIKCLLRDGVIEKASEVTDLMNKYLTDPQYDEMKPTDEAN